MEVSLINFQMCVVQIAELFQTVRSLGPEIKVNHTGLMTFFASTVLS